MTEWRSQDPDIDALFSQLEASDKLYVMVDADEFANFDDFVGTQGWTLGGAGEADLVDGMASRLGLTDVAGFAVVSGRGAYAHGLGRTTAGRVGIHEAVHLKGVDDRGRKYGHCESAFDHDAGIQSRLGLGSYRTGCRGR